ncbi:MAG TPA: protein kinase [Gemmataceae bacterium]|jgi:WD40 repeat protein/serine/threonine protein kinase
MSIASVASLLELLRQSPLLESEQMAELDRPSDGRFADARSLAAELLRRGWLTPYQVNQLFQGRGQQLILGSFVLLERLGEGGMGQVFKARHRKLGRIVALKLIRKERLDHPDAVRRFRREIEAASKLSHPNIVLALDADEVNDTQFFAMEYVEGIDLAKHVKQQGPLPVDVASDYIRQAALGLQHAHERGMVHRDIKPHNLLLTAQTGTIKVLDMGLARLSSDSHGGTSSGSLTQEGAVMGTPDYIAPEQALDSHSADIRADLYSLGCTFYFLLTGQVPFPGGTVMEKLFRHQTQPPRSLLALRPEVPAPVVGVVNRLMAKRASERFQTPAELVAALDKARETKTALAAVPVAAGVPQNITLPAALPDQDGSRPNLEQGKTPRAASQSFQATSTGSMTSPFAGLRHDTIRQEEDACPADQMASSKRVLLLSAAGGGALIALLLLVLLFRRGSTDRAAADITSSSTMAESPGASSAEKEWKALRARAETKGVDRTKLRNEIIAFRRKYAATREAREASEWLMRLPSPLDRWNVLPLSPWQKLDGQPKELLAVLGDHRSWVGHAGGGNRQFVQHSSDGGWLACNAGDGTIRLLDPGDLSIRAILKADEPQVSLDVRRDGKVIVTSGRTSVVLWDVRGKQPQQIGVLKGFPGWVGAVALSPDGKQLAIPCETQTPTVRLWDIAGEPKEQAVLKGHATGIICKPAFSPDGKTLATGSTDKTIHIWDLSAKEPRERAVLKDHTYWVVSVTFSPDGKLLASSGQHDYTIRLWDMTAAEPKELTGGPWLGEATDDAVFSPDGKRLACAFWGGQWRMWEVSDGQLKPIAQVPDHRTVVWAISFSPDGRTLATASADGTVHLWSVQDMPPRQHFVSPGHGQPITSLAFTPDDGTLVSMARDGTVRLWNLQTPPERERATLAIQPGFACGAVHPDGRTLVTCDGTDKRVFWDIASGKELRSAPGRVWHTAYRPDGKMLIGTTDNYDVTFWDTESGEMKRVERGEPNSGMSALAISPDGRRVAVSDVRGVIHLWHTGDAREHRSCKAPEGCASGLTFSADSKTLAAAGKDGRLHLFDVTTTRERSSFPAHEREVAFLTYSPDGKQLISAGADGRIVIQDSSNGRELRSLKMPVTITAAALAGDGRHLAVGHVDGALSILRIKLESPTEPRP